MPMYDLTEKADFANFLENCGEIPEGLFIPLDSEFHEEMMDDTLAGYLVDRIGPTRVTCCQCGEKVLAKTAHIHQGKLIGDECCWDERLRSSE